MIVQGTADTTVRVSFIKSVSNVCTAARSCQSLSVSNGSVACDNNNIEGSRCTVSCNRGYQIQGQTTLTCQDSGTWTPAQPTCDGKVIPSWTCFICNSVLLKKRSFRSTVFQVCVLDGNICFHYLLRLR